MSRLVTKDARYKVGEPLDVKFDFPLCLGF